MKFKTLKIVTLILAFVALALTACSNNINQYSPTAETATSQEAKTSITGDEKRENTPVYALDSEQSTAIQTVLDEAVQKSGVPGMSVSVRTGNELQYFSSGYANREKAIPSNEDTLYMIGSISKSFTAFGILLLEEQGLLSMDDPIQKYLPWFTLRYNGQPVNMEEVTLNSFLHHTSGLNNKHFSMIPFGEGPSMLQKTVEAFVDAELAFAPGERFDYGSMNYDMLALVTAIVSGQSWDDYMQRQVFEPLGLHDTYLSSHEAMATGRYAQGYSIAFQRVFPFNAPLKEGAVPAGGIISCLKDMSRWADIQLSLVDVPEIYRKVIAKSHQGDTTVPPQEMQINGDHYAGGWIVDEVYVGHGGHNVNTTAELLMHPKEELAICLLTNGGHTNAIKIAENIKSILVSNTQLPYTLQVYQVLDQIGTWATLAGVIITLLFFYMGFRRWKKRKHVAMSKAQCLIVIIWCLITAFILGVSLMIPSFFGADWKSALEEAMAYSTLTACVMFVLSGCSIAWFVFAKRDVKIKKADTQ